MTDARREPLVAELGHGNSNVNMFNGIEMRISSLDDIWLTQKQIAKVFKTSVQNVSKHAIALKKEPANWEGLSSVINQQLITEKNGRHEGFTQTRKVEVYGFEFICQIGYKAEVYKASD